MFNDTTARMGDRRIAAVSTHWLGGLLLGLLLAGVSVAAPAQKEERSGKEVVEGTCAGCHATGVNGAPRIGDKVAWSKLSAQGLTSLTKVALTGIRKMPPHGANMNSLTRK